MITANITVIIMASTRLITSTDEVGMDKVIAAKTDIEALATIEEALIEGTIKNR